MEIIRPRVEELKRKGRELGLLNNEKINEHESDFNF